MPFFLGFIKGDPLIDVAGAYFPAWLACMVVAAIVTWGVHEGLEKLGWSQVMRPGALMVPGLFVALSCSMWLVFFAAR